MRFANNLPTVTQVKENDIIYLNGSPMNLRIDIRQFPKIIKIEFPLYTDESKLRKLIKSVFFGWSSLSFCQAPDVDNHGGLKTKTILWIQWMNAATVAKSAPKCEYADIPFYISIKKKPSDKKKPSEKRYIISFTNAIF